jgi:hypothetical protein
VIQKFVDQEDKSRREQMRYEFLLHSSFVMFLALCACIWYTGTRAHIFPFSFVFGSKHSLVRSGR